MSQVLATQVNSAPTTKTLMTFNCKACGKEMLKVWGTPKLPERVKCPHCPATYRVHTNSTPHNYPKHHPQVSKWTVMGTALVPAIATALLGSFITGSFPEPGDPPKVKIRKSRAVVGTFVAGAFIGVTAGIIAAETIA